MVPHELHDVVHRKFLVGLDTKRQGLRFGVPHHVSGGELQRRSRAVEHAPHPCFAESEGAEIGREIGVREGEVLVLLVEPLFPAGERDDIGRVEASETNIPEVT